MQWKDRRRHGLCIAVFALVLQATMGPEAAAQQVTWELFDVEDDPEGQNDKRVACGHYGVFYLQVTNALPLAPEPEPAIPRAKGIEVPRLYPRFLTGGPAPPSPIEPVPVVPSTRLGSLGTSVTPLPAPHPIKPVTLPPPWFPCDQGQCFGDPLNFGANQPWVAVVDWDGPHGWSVGWTIRQVAGPGVTLGLLPLTDEDLESVPRRGETDAHLLTRLCNLAELIEVQGVPPPLVVNMSFGRLAHPEDRVAADQCDETRIVCQIAQVIEHLRLKSQARIPPPGTIFVAAAGNHQDLLYPAVAPGVLAAGSLDLAAFWETGITEETWETPKLTGEAAALMPGYGICLFPGPLPQAEKGHPTPPGTSYATATFSGFLVAPLLAGLIEDPLRPLLWTPVASCTEDACSYQIAYGNQRLYNASSGLTLLLEQARTGTPACRPPNEGQAEVYAFTGEPVTLDAMPLLSFDDIAAAARKQPAPGSDPCVPCHGHNQPPPLTASGSRGLASRFNPLDLELDLSFAGALPADFTLNELYLRVEQDFYPISVQGSQFTNLQEGEVDRLIISGAGDLIPWGEQASLILVLTDNGADVPQQFWTSVPILMR